MNTKQGSVMVLKSRSQSMPSICPIIVPQPIHKGKLGKIKKQQLKREKSHVLPVISLFSSKNKQQEEINNKIKIISQRNMKKLEQKYETIDRWKQRYLSEGTHITLKYKPTFKEIFPIKQEENGSSIKQTNNQIKNKESEKLLPVVSKQPISPEIPNHHEQSKKLEAQLLARLLKNKRYYEKKNSQIYKDINYFEQSDELPFFDKNRDASLKKSLTNPENNKNSMLNIFNKKIIYKRSSKLEEDHLKQSLKKRLEDYGQKRQGKLFKSKSIYEYKEQLMEDAIHHTPEGWDAPEDPHSIENQEQIQ